MVSAAKWSQPTQKNLFLVAGEWTIFSDFTVLVFISLESLVNIELHMGANSHAIPKRDDDTRVADIADVAFWGSNEAFNIIPFSHGTTM